MRPWLSSKVSVVSLRLHAGQELLCRGRILPDRRNLARQGGKQSRFIGQADRFLLQVVFNGGQRALRQEHGVDGDADQRRHNQDGQYVAEDQTAAKRSHGTIPTGYLRR